MAATRALLRLARRSSTKAPLRSLLVVLLIAMLVAAGTAFSAVFGSFSTSQPESHRAEIGNAATIVSFGSDGGLLSWWVGGGAVRTGVGVYAGPEGGDLESTSDFDYAKTIDVLRKRLGADFSSVRVASALVNQDAVGPFGDQFTPVLGDISRHDPVEGGNFVLVEGRLPNTPGEVAISTQVSYRLNLELGGQRQHADTERTVVGVVATRGSGVGPLELVTSQAWESAMAASPARTMAVRLFVQEAWSQAEILAALETVDEVVGLPAIARTSQASYRIAPTGSLERQPHATDSAASVRVVPILLTVVVGAQVALVATAAFAVAVRRRTREFGQLVSTGANASHLRRLVLTEAVLLGSAGALVGIASGVLVGRWFVRLDLMRDAPSFGVPLEFTALDLLVPAAIGIAASVLAAWWPARAIAQAPVTATLAGLLPTAPVRAVTALRGLVVLGLGTAGFTLIAVELAGSSSSGSSTNLLLIVAAASILAMFGGALMLVGPLLAWVGRRADRFPLFARLVTRSSDRHRGRSWVVVGAFVATIALPIIFGASIKAYPNSWANSPEAPLDGQLLSMRTASWWETNQEADRSSLATQDTLAQLDNSIGATAAEIVGPLASAPILDLPDHRLVLPAGYNWTYGVTMLVATPEMTELLELPDDLVRRLDAEAIVDLGYQRLMHSKLSIRMLNTDTDGWLVDVVQGPALFDSVVLVSEELVAEIEAEARVAGTVYRSTNAISSVDETRIMRQANMDWARYRDELELDAGAVVPVDLAVQRRPDLGPSARTARLWSLGVTAAIATLIAFVTAALAAVEVDREMRAMVAIGAAPSSRRVLLAGQTLYHLLIAAMIGIPLAILTYWGAARADDNGPTWPTVPWESIAVMGLVVPVVVSGLVALVFRNAKPAVSRRLS